jgi:hypothetical protein
MTHLKLNILHKVLILLASIEWQILNNISSMFDLQKPWYNQVWSKYFPEESLKEKYLRRKEDFSSFTRNAALKRTSDRNGTNIK